MRRTEYPRFFAWRIDRLPPRAPAGHAPTPDVVPPLPLETVEHPTGQLGPRAQESPGRILAHARGGVSDPDTPHELILLDITGVWGRV